MLIFEYNSIAVWLNKFANPIVNPIAIDHDSLFHNLNANPNANPK